MRFCQLVRLSSVFIMLLLCNNCVPSAFFNNSLEENNVTQRYFTEDLVVSSRKKKKGVKYLIPILFGALMVKSILLPLAFKAMAVMSSIAVLLSTMSLIVSSIVGYVKLAMRSNHPPVKIIHVNDNYPVTWAKDDDSVKVYGTESLDYDPNGPIESIYRQHPFIK